MKLLGLIILFFPVSLLAQIKFNHISVNDGLSQSAVHAFAQDEQGYLWIATRDGLNQYDGKYFTIYRHHEGDSSSISSNIVWSVCKDEKRGIWAATDAGISYYDPLQKSFQNYAPEGLQQEFPLCRTLVQNGDYLFLSTNKGCWIFHIPSQSWHFVSKLGEVNTSFATIIHDGRVLIGNNNGLFQYDLDTQTSTTLLQDKLTACTGIYQEQDKYIITSRTHLFVLDAALSIQKEVQFTTDPIYFKIKIAKDPQSRTWISGRNIFLFNSEYELLQELTSSPLDEYSLSSSYTTDVFVTDDGTVWVGTNGLGINKYHPFQASINTLSYNPYHKDALSNSYMSGMITHNGLLYAGSNEAIDVIDYRQYPAQNINKLNFSSLNIGQVNAFLSLPEGGLLLGTEKGLIELDTFAKRWHSQFRIFDLARLADGQILIATAHGNEGLVVFNPEDKQYRELNLLPEDEALRCILVEEEQIWVGSDRTLYKVSASLDAYEVVSPDEIPYPTPIKCIFRDSQNILWTGSWGKGLFQLNEQSQKFEAFSGNDQLTNNTIYGILEDESHNLWMSSNNGIICYLREDKQLIHFSADQGLQSNEFNTGSYHKGEDGTLFFGGINGLSYFKPPELLSAPASSRLFITNVWVNQERMDQATWEGKKFVLEPDQENIRIEYTSVTFNASTDIKYRYKLSENAPYIENQNINHITLSNLNVGSYQLILNCTDPYGRWRDEVTTLSFVIRPPVWLRPWFIALAALSLLLLGLLFNQWRVQYYQKKNEKLENAVNERTQKISEQNNEILAQNEELQAQGNMLTDQNNQLEIQREELLELKKSLERRVQLRTADLHQKNEELQQQYQQMEQFSYITSHNLKGPIASLKGLLSLIPVVEKQEDQLVIDKMRISIVKLESIINDLASIMEIQKKSHAFQPIYLSKVIRQVVENLQAMGRKNKVKIILEEPLSEVKIRGVNEHVYNIFHNLIHNAIKYSKVRFQEAYVRISFIQFEDQISVEIKDNGIGIDMKYAQKKLFRLFQRFNNIYDGKGIGLYMSKVQVESMNGSISLESELGKGTKVTVSFPPSVAEEMS